ncbi:MAG: Ig-like domain-containing protein [Chloroflexi bacterium]|nr:Ig-like domain-containing protein [Chloroflexota bacterium]
MFKVRNLLYIMLTLIVVVGCESSATPTAEPTPQPTTPPVTVPSPAPVIFKPGELFPLGISNEALSVLTTQPLDKTEDAPVAKDKARIVVQFNHPVVPLVSVEAQKRLPQPLSIEPAAPGEGQWVNTSTYVFTPNQALRVAMSYTVTVGTVKDMFGQTLTAFAWSFKTVPPAVINRFPDDNTQFVGTTQPISMTFNIAMLHLYKIIYRWHTETILS